jgi:plasmid maintenance system antidote protein VapI
MSIATILSIAIKLSGKSHYRLALISGVNRTTIDKIVKNPEQCNLTEDVVEKICKALKLKIYIK